MTDRKGGKRPAAGSARLRGAEGRAQMQEELARQKQKAEERKNQTRMPFRFYVPVGETRQAIVLDDEPDFFMYEHAMKDAQGKWGRLFSGCVRTYDHCPVCESLGRESYYGLFLSIVDLTPFPTRDGGEQEFSRKLLVVKPAQQKKFLRFYEKHGTLRGALFEFTRDGDKDPSIGNDLEFIEFVDEDELSGYVRSWKDQEGKKHTEDCSEVYDYDELFPEPNVDELRALVGGSPVPGSREADRGARSSGTSRRPSRGKDKDDWEDEDSREEYGSRKRPARGRKAEEEEEAPRGRSRPRRAEPEEEEEEETPRSRRGRKEEPEEAPRRSRGRREEPEEEEEEEEDDEPTPPRRQAVKSPAKGATKGTAAKGAPTRRRGRDEEEEEEEADGPPWQDEEEEEEEPPRRGRRTAKDDDDEPATPRRIPARRGRK